MRWSRDEIGMGAEATPRVFPFSRDVTALESGVPFSAVPVVAPRISRGVRECMYKCASEENDRAGGAQQEPTGLVDNVA